MSRVAPVAILLVAVGCGGGDSIENVTVKGTITFDGKPIEKGDVKFVPALGRGPSAGGVITNGSYSVEIPAGEMIVEITAVRETGKLITGGWGEKVPEVEQYLPDCYNSESQLTATPDSAVNTIDFELRSDCE